MLEVLKFIFSSFWIWAGSVVILCVLGNAAIYITRAIVGKRS